jgi:hypothetical protein
MVRLLAVLCALTSERGGAELEELVLSAIHNCPCLLPCPSLTITCVSRGSVLRLLYEPQSALTASV